jgi:predicted GIY-YIG superfamily endonuclease
MYYTYVIETQNEPKHYYMGSTEDLAARLADHNAGRSPHQEIPSLEARLVLCVHDLG